MKKIIFLVSLVCSFGCSTISKFSEGDVGELRENVSRFNKALYWGKVEEIAMLIKPASQNKLLNEFESRVQSEKLVGIQNTNFQVLNGNKKANVTVKVDYYKKSSNIVNARKEVLVWEYLGSGSGWLLADVYESEAGKPTTERIKIGG